MLCTDFEGCLQELRMFGKPNAAKAFPISPIWAYEMGYTVLTPTHTQDDLEFHSLLVWSYTWGSWLWH